MKISVSVIICVISTFNFVCGFPANTKRDLENSDYEEWLRNLESQIITGSQEKEVDSNINEPIATIGYNDIIEEDEPIVVTAKPYLTGGEMTPETDSTTTEEIEWNLNTETILFLQETIDDNGRVKSILDSLAERFETLNSTNNQKSIEQQSNDAFNDGSEMKTFVVIIKNQTSIVILVIILSSVTLIGLILITYRIVNQSSNNSAITLISHYEYDDINGEKRNVEKAK